MAHYANLNTDGIVETVLVADSAEWCENALGGVWVQTSYNTYGGVHYDPETRQPSEDQSKALRFNYAGVGFSYDEDRDAFIPPTPYPSWVLDEDTCLWAAPVALPDDADTVAYEWDEEDQSWEAQAS